MTPKEAARVIGCSPQQVRHLIRTGVLRARETNPVTAGGQTRYSLSRNVVERYAKTPQTVGYPRGVKRRSKG